VDLRVIISTDLNPNYLAFLPSAFAHWEKHGLQVTVALVVSSDDERKDSVVDAILSAVKVDIRVLTIDQDPSLPVDHAAKLARGFLATQFGDDVVTIVDIDYYLLWFDEWLAHLKCTPNNGLLTLGYNLYWGTKDEGKYPMYLGTAQSTTFAQFLNPERLTTFDAWIKKFRGIHVFDDHEDPYSEFGSFSDESLFRALLSRNNNAPPVVCVNRPMSWTRIDRQQEHPITLEEVCVSSDVFPNRPLSNCITYFTSALKIYEYLNISNPTRDADFVEALRVLKLQTRYWAKPEFEDIQSLYECVEARNIGLIKH